MPDDGKPEPVRVVIDETSFDFRDLPPGTIETHLDSFNDTMLTLRADGVPVRKAPLLDAAACTAEHELFTYLNGEPGRHIDRDTRLAFLGLVSKCQEWDEPPSVALDITIDGGEPATAFSLGFALAHELNRFWRHLFQFEDIPETGFFALAARAFPQLIFSPRLSFRRFRGSYRDLRAPVITHLGVLNDHFLAAHDSAKGIPAEVERILTAKGCGGVSPESPGTHNNKQLMRQRDVPHNGTMLRCEWHSKISPRHNRIHFAFGGDLGDQVFIGIFADHLDT